MVVLITMLSEAEACVYLHEIVICLGSMKCSILSGLIINYADHVSIFVAAVKAQYLMRHI